MKEKDLEVDHWSCFAPCEKHNWMDASHRERRYDEEQDETNWFANLAQSLDVDRATSWGRRQSRH